MYIYSKHHIFKLSINGFNLNESLFRLWHPRVFDEEFPWTNTLVI